LKENYFTFPLAVLHGVAKQSNPCDIIELALHCGVISAGIGLYKNDSDRFREMLDEVVAKHDIKWKNKENSHRSMALVGAKLCGVNLGGTYPAYLDGMIDGFSFVAKGGPLVRMAAKYFWPALYQAQAEQLPDKSWPERGISWREFRILCAILSVKTNRAGFSFIGWETIQARSSGFTTKAEIKAATKIPEHLAPALTRKQIRMTCDALEDLGFYARFRFSTGPSGGRMAYSFRHDRAELAKVVCDSVNFHDRARIKQNRAIDAAKCLELLERAKSGPSVE
jgi:hypothetical protein